MLHTACYNLERVVSLGEINGPRVHRKPDKRHVELIVSSLGLDDGNTKSATTPSVRPSDAEAEQLLHGPKLSASETSLYRSCVMRVSFLSQDRADLGESVKALAQGMASPARAHLQALQRLGRFLHRSTVQLDSGSKRSAPPSPVWWIQTMHCSAHRHSHTIKSTSNLQTSWF